VGIQELCFSFQRLEYISSKGQMLYPDRIHLGQIGHHIWCLICYQSMFPEDKYSPTSQVHSQANPTVG